MSKPQFFVEKKDKNNSLSSANKKVNENSNENKEKKFYNEDDSFTIEIEDENPNNINNNVYNFDFNLRDKNYDLKNYPFSNLISSINSKYILYKYLLIIDNCLPLSNLMKNNEFELDDEINANDAEKMIKEAYENKRKRLLESLKLEKEMQINKVEEDTKIKEKRLLNDKKMQISKVEEDTKIKEKRLLDEKEMQKSKVEEDAKIQKKRITDLINLEMDNMIKIFREKKEFKELKKKLKIDNYGISPANQEDMMKSFRKNIFPNDAVDKIDKKEK